MTLHVLYVELIPICVFLPIPQNGSHSGSDLVTRNSCRQNRKYKPKLKLHLSSSQLLNLKWISTSTFLLKYRSANSSLPKDHVGEYQIQYSTPCSTPGHTLWSTWTAHLLDSTPYLKLFRSDTLSNTGQLRQV